MAVPQPGIFAQGTRSHHHLELAVPATVSTDELLVGLRGLREPKVSSGGANLVVGFGAELWGRLAPEAGMPAGLRPFAAIDGLDGHTAPATQHDLWVWVHGTGEDVAFDVARHAALALADAAEVVVDVPGFVYLDSRDLTGFVDGTANPRIDEAPAVACVPDGRPGAGGSFAITQRWIHDLDAFDALPVEEQERVFGRTKPDSTELDDDRKPATAHIARMEVDDESGEELEIYRRSVPYGTVGEHGLYFVAFSAELSRFDVMLARQFGTAGDGVRDRLTDFTRPVTGSYWFVPSLDDLDALLGSDGRPGVAR